MFMKYFIFELKDIMARSWLPVLLCGLTPVFLLVLTWIYMTSAHVMDWHIGGEMTMGAVCFAVSVFFFLFFPIYTYGKITDRKLGSQYLMLPVSSSLKFASAVMISVVVIPLIFILLVLGSDALMAFLFPERVTTTQVELLCNSFWGSEDPNSMIFRLHILSPIFLPFMVSSAGLCGAVLFKRRKATKTFITSVISFIAVCLLYSLISKEYKNCGYTPDFLGSGFVWTWLIFQTVAALCCLAYVFYRIRKTEL